jgi:hypothetical protein
MDERPAPAAQRAPEEAERDVPAVASAPAEPEAAEPPPSAALERVQADAPSVGAAGRAEVAQAPPQAAAEPAPEPELPADAVADARALDDAPTGAGTAFGGALARLDSLQAADAARVQQRLDSAAGAAESRRRIAADQVVTSTLDAAPAAPALQRSRAANEVPRGDDETSPSLVVPGLEVLDVRPVSEGTAFAGVRAYQRLASGDTLEVVHLPEGIDPELLPPLPVGRSQLTRQTPEGWLVMRAPLSLLELEQLLERLEAGR